MKRNPLWFLIIVAIGWPVTIYNNGWRDLSETHPLIFASIMSFLFIATIFPFLIYLAYRQDQERDKLREKIDKDTNPKYANILRWNGRTPLKGEYVVCLNEDNWVIVQWNKEPGHEPWMAIFTPPKHEDRTNLIARQWYNGQMEEVQKVRVEDLPRIS